MRNILVDLSFRSGRALGRSIVLLADGTLVLALFVCLVAIGAVSLLGCAVYGGWSVIRR